MRPHFIVAFVAVATLTACNPKVDASSTPALVASVAKVSATLNSEERERFYKAFAKLAYEGATQADLIDLAKNADKILPNARKAVQGKTAKQIITEAGIQDS